MAGCILLIHADNTLLPVMKLALERAGYVVRISTRPEEGLNVYAEHCRDIDLVLLGFVFPHMTGDLIFTQLQQIKSDVRVLLVTGCCDIRQEQMLANGLGGRLIKPFTLKDFLGEIRGVVMRECKNDAPANPVHSSASDSVPAALVPLRQVAIK